MPRRAVVEADLRFGETRLAGNWSPPEQGFAWSEGASSEAMLRCGDDEGARLLLLEGHPFLHPPELATQRLGVAVNGQLVAAGAFDEQFLIRIPVPAGVVRHGRAALRLDHPDHAAPLRFGGSDARSLGFRFRRATLFRFETVARVPDVALPVAGALAQLAGLRGRGDLSADAMALCTTILDGRAAAIDPVAPASLQLFSAAVRSGLMLAASLLLRLANGAAAVSAEIDATTAASPLAVRVTKHPGGGLCLGFHPAVALAGADGVGIENLVARRALEATGLLLRYAQGQGLIGDCLLNLGDDAIDRGLALCHRPGMHRVLIPDTDFLRSRGYAAERGDAAHPWQARREVALWRGGIGGCQTRDFSRWPRARLCALARQSALVDAAFSGLEDMRPDEAAAVRAAGLGGDYVPARRFQEWKYLIDIDGNTNAWSGLFRKLLSGSVVLKVASADSFRQWYYERMRPWREFVPVRADLADLEEKIAALRGDDALARRIGEAGRRFALEMTFARETDWAMAQIETAICAEARRRADADAD